MLKSSVCRGEHFRSDWFATWAYRMGYPPPAEAHIHRKLWEWCAIAQALFERGALAPGKRGLGFAVGKEPLASTFAQLGTTVLATDLGAGATAELWSSVNQHAEGLEELYFPAIIDRAAFDGRVTFEHADMNDISTLPRDSYDFLWSSCAIEHTGSLDHASQFVQTAMDLLKPGGIACHTTEFNVSSVDDTIETGDSVIFRERDIVRLDGALRLRRCCIENIDFKRGCEPLDVLFDAPPWGENGRKHVKLFIEGHVATSMLLICRKY